LVTYLAGPGHVFIGRGLSEISSAAFLYLSALMVIAARASRSSRLVAAGVFAVLATWTRENNLPMVLGVALFACPLDLPASALWTPRRWLVTAWRPALLAIPLALVVGMGLFAWRTWYFTGEWSVRFGPQLNYSAVWQPGMLPGDWLSAVWSSLMMLALTTDPPHFHNGAIPILAGAALSVVALIGAPFARRLPLVLVLWALFGFVPALLVRGNGYSGRFSVHLIGSTVAVLMCAIAAVFERRQAPVVDDQKTAA
jgi:hypothetical protein